MSDLNTTTMQNLTTLRNFYYRAVNAGCDVTYDSEANWVKIKLDNGCEYNLQGNEAKKWFYSLERLHKEFPTTAYGVLALVASYPYC